MEVDLNEFYNIEVADCTTQTMGECASQACQTADSIPLDRSRLFLVDGPESALEMAAQPALLNLCHCPQTASRECEDLLCMDAHSDLHTTSFDAPLPLATDWYGELGCLQDAIKECADRLLDAFECTAVDVYDQLGLFTDLDFFERYDRWYPGVHPPQDKRLPVLAH